MNNEHFLVLTRCWDCSIASKYLMIWLLKSLAFSFCKDKSVIMSHAPRQWKRQLRGFLPVSTTSAVDGEEHVYCETRHFVASTGVITKPSKTKTAQRQSQIILRDVPKFQGRFHI